MYLGRHISTTIRIVQIPLVVTSGSGCGFLAGTTAPPRLSIMSRTQVQRQQLAQNNMDFDYNAFVADLKSKNAVPLVVVYGTSASGGGVDLDWLSTNAFDNGDKTLKHDTTKAVGAVYEQMKKENV